MNKGVKFRIYPNKSQQTLINQTLGCYRLIYNKGLSLRKESFENGLSIGYKETSSMLTDLKKDNGYSFLKDADSIALQQSLRDLDSAYKRFFKKLGDYPNFKSKHNHNQSYRTINQGDNIRIVDKNIKLPKLGYVKFKQSMDIGHINNVTVERTSAGKYYAVLNVDFEPAALPFTSKVIGIDVGLKEFYTDSKGNTVHNPKYFEKSNKKLVHEQRKLSHMIESHIVDYKVIGNKRFPIYDKPLRECRNIEKQRKKIALIHEKITNQRNDFLQKESTKLIRENQIISIEDLNVKGLLQNHKLAKSISSVSWSKFFNMLEYKAKWYGRIIVKVPSLYPSSQTCSICGYKNTEVKDLGIRKWTCPKCGIVHDRDLNASINILNKGLESAIRI
ncbi:MAG: IS200/IS605 family element RNA-guided endonuclease TnpB [Erysipelotrichaceae bacterium]|nr:IS200/IS605 family element RNA-guided endonuclease TnpB [Solobacterium sp.]MDY2731839.1 IS200/IS605 family element RNA-guided endonuclease TnpB [Erysipelotrichaceae bacterium]